MSLNFPIHKVSERALFARVSRALYRRDGFILRRCAERSRWFWDLGRFYAINESKHIRHADIDLEEFAKELGVMKPNEALEG